MLEFPEKGGNPLCCSFGEFTSVNNIFCESNAKADCNKVLPLISCNKSIESHCRRFHINFKDVNNEADLLKYRGGLFDIPTEQCTICPNHRYRLGLGWRSSQLCMLKYCSRGKETQKRKKPLLKGTIALCQSLYLWKQRHQLIQIGSGVCTFCRKEIVKELKDHETKDNKDYECQLNNETCIERDLETNMELHSQFYLADQLDYLMEESQSVEESERYEITVSQLFIILFCVTYVSSAMLQLFGTTSETLATPQAIETTESPTVLDSPNVDCNLDLTVSAPIPDQRKEDDTWFSTHIDLICLPTAAHIVIHDDTACHVASISQSEGISFKGFTNEEIKTKQSEDPDLLVLLNWLKDQVEPSQNTLFSASPAVKSYWINKEKFFLDDNGILKSYPKDEGASVRLVIPSSLKDTVMELCHELPSAGHQGMIRTMAKVKTRYQWYRMTSDINPLTFTVFTAFFS
ncbi:unnamed protein product [Mytilus edulis]|uniref:Integrase zinc-binding domain-containing protein n=1 Tax=Mytilus edulis TaxID=6550 RepID=A0A8S3PZX4_MYTED|nr:unnamed protein product [Mytilus edulis]